MLVVNAARKDADLAHLRARLDPAVTDRAAVRARRCWRCRGRMAAAVLARFVARHRPHPVHERRRRRDRRRAVRASPAPAIPARTGTRFRARPSTRSRSPRRCSPSRRWRRSGLARATRCGSKPGSASTATISTRPPPRSRPASPGRSASAAAPRAAFPAPRIILRAAGRGARRAAASASAPTAAPRRARAAPIIDAAGDPIGTVTSGGFGPSVNAPIAMGYVDARACRRGQPRLPLSCATSPRPARVAPMPFVPTRYYRG